MSMVITSAPLLSIPFHHRRSYDAHLSVRILRDGLTARILRDGLTARTLRDGLKVRPYSVDLVACLQQPRVVTPASFVKLSGWWLLMPLRCVPESINIARARSAVAWPVCDGPAASGRPLLPAPVHVRPYRCRDHSP